MLRQRELHLLSRFSDSSISIQRPRHQVVAVHILAVTQLTPRALEYIGAVARRSVIEKEESPGAMNGTWLLERAH
jgi:hypothetical protein